MKDKDQFSKIDSIMSVANQDFVTTFESVAADKLMQELLPEKDYLRVNVDTNALMDDKDIEKMISDGNKMYENS